MERCVRAATNWCSDTDSALLDYQGLKMKKYQVFLKIIFSIVVLKYNLSAYVQPLWFEEAPEIQSTAMFQSLGTRSHDESKIAKL